MGHRRRKHTRKQRGGNKCNESIHTINCSLLGIKNPDTVTSDEANNAYTNTLSELRIRSASKNSMGIILYRRITLAHQQVLECIHSRGHVAHPPKSRRPKTPRPRRTLKANPDGILRSQSERKLRIRTPDNNIIGAEDLKINSVGLS